MNEIRGRKRQKMKGSVRKLKHMQEQFGFCVKRDRTIERLSHLLKQKI